MHKVDLQDACYRILINNGDFELIIKNPGSAYTYSISFPDFTSMIKYCKALKADGYRSTLN